MTKIILPKSAISQFLTISQENFDVRIETIGILCGKRSKRSLKVTRVLIPEQTGSLTSCEALSADEILKYQEENELIDIGWIHTHPTFSAFMSSIDVHKHCARQKLMKESIAVVCSIKDNITEIFNLTADGLNIIGNCKIPGPHDHAHSMLPIYKQATHVEIVNEMFTELHDQRYTS